MPSPWPCRVHILSFRHFTTSPLTRVDIVSEVMPRAEQQKIAAEKQVWSQKADVQTRCSTQESETASPAVTRFTLMIGVWGRACLTVLGLLSRRQTNRLHLLDDDGRPCTPL